MHKLHNSPYLLNSFLHEFPKLVQLHGGDLTALCQAVELPVEDVTQKNKLVAFDKFIRLLEEAANQFNYPEIAFELAARQSIDTLGPVFMLLEGCNTFGEALHRILNYFDIITSGLHIEVRTSSALLELIFHVEMPQLIHRQQFQNYLLASCVSIIRNLMVGRFPIRGCYFTREEHDAKLQKKHIEFFGCPVAFGSDSIRLVFSSDILKVNIKDVQVEAPNLMIERKPEPSLKAQLEAILPLYLASSTTNLSTIAKAMGYSTATFRRRLKHASISFSDTLEAIKLHHANQYLHSTHYSLNDISALLGYSNQSAFTRSYIRWYGMTPSQYRQRIKRQT
ncbi:AraC family transcriptional regulator [Shewanella metallivivens]|uniref:AraC family transcriptional regulator ligand-binding domain-containing protein n=1 Tax=Shewanella metallivivens TaxID=2872342 RepID=A0ABT5THR4_9GAMM|nr:AraC family transcriptional regulator [Shewanella metallivivens]MDD8058084.1 AraC family transcriptional regulator ligand-binding domain-containing protein [Shewanella metallivivens]